MFSFIKNKKGSGLVPYGIVIGLICVVSIGSISVLGGKTESIFSTTENKLDTALFGSGGSSNEESEEDACLTGPVGTFCEDGSVYVGSLGDGARRYMAGSDLSGKRFAGQASAIGLTDLSDGEGNTDILTPSLDSSNDGNRTGTAAMDCRNELGSNWYLPAQNEFDLVMTAVLGGNLTLNGVGIVYNDNTERYVTSNERSPFGSPRTVFAQFEDDRINYSTGSGENYVRCFKK